MILDFAVAQEFRALSLLPDDEIDLAKAALLVARTEYPELEVSAYARRISEMSSALDSRLGTNPSLSRIIGELNSYLYDELGFAGNVDDYFDPRNSFLNEVLERRLGIPISLSIVYMEVGRRIGLPLRGVSFPGHFLVKMVVSGGEVVLDPFCHGASLTLKDLKTRLRTVCPEETEVDDYLKPATNREILVRMLRNLKSIYFDVGKFEKALRASEHLLALRPGDHQEIRDRGYIYEQMECPAAASRDFQAYLRLAPQASDSEHIRDRFIRNQSSSGSLH